MNRPWIIRFLVALPFVKKSIIRKIYLHMYIKHIGNCVHTFSQAYFLIASDEDSEYVFPEFTKKVKN